VALGQTYFAVQTRLQEIRQIDEYNNLSSEDEKRLFLRDEMAKHNIQNDVFDDENPEEWK
jgi:DNA-damage-inducible protein D